MRTLEVADALALVLVEDVVGRAPWVLVAFFFALAGVWIKASGAVHVWLVWAHAAAGVFIEGLGCLAGWFVWAYALALGAVKDFTEGTVHSFPAALALACLGVERLMWGTVSFLADA